VTTIPDQAHDFYQQAQFHTAAETDVGSQKHSWSLPASQSENNTELLTFVRTDGFGGIVRDVNIFEH
jgi:hypothetical protein